MKMLYTLLLILTIYSCKKATGIPPEEGRLRVDPVSSVRAFDISNNHNATDLEIEYVRPALAEGISELMIIVVKTAKADDFNREQANQLSADRFQAFSLENALTTQNIEESLLDSDGDEIVEGTPYSVFIYSKASLESQLADTLSSASNSITLKNEAAVRTLVTIQAGSGGMDVDEAGNIYMADFGPDLNGGGNTVYKITPEGSVSVFASGLNGASGNDFDLQGNLYQSNITGSFISKVSPTGQIQTVASSGIQGPVGIAFSESGDFYYVANCGNNTIMKVMEDGTSTLFSSSPLLSCPNGIDIDANGSVFVANFSNGNIVKITEEGTASIFASIPGGSVPTGNNGHLLFNNSDLYVIGRSDHRIYKVNSTGHVTVFAGNGNRGSANGPLLQASFSLPNDLAFSPDGKKIYINDVSPTSGANNIISPIIIRVIELPD